MEVMTFKMLLTPGGGSARVLRGARHSTWNAWCEKTVHHFDQDQEGKKGNKNFSGKLPKTATSIRSSFIGDSTSPELSGDPRATSQQARTPGASQAEGGQARAPATRLAERKNKHVFQRSLRLVELGRDWGLAGPKIRIRLGSAIPRLLHIGQMGSPDRIDEGSPRIRLPHAHSQEKGFR